MVSAFVASRTAETWILRGRITMGICLVELGIAVQLKRTQSQKQTGYSPESELVELADHEDRE